MFEKLRGYFMNMLSYFRKTTIEEVTGINTNISNIKQTSNILLALL